MSLFKRLVRFETAHGEILFGEATDSNVKPGDVVPVYSGTLPWELECTNSVATVSKILSPLPSTPIIYGIGLNYKSHIKEANWPTPEYPTVFTKAPDTLNGPYDDVIFPSEEWNMDFEGELCVVIGKDCKDLGENEDPTPFILGYMSGNDVSARYWQVPARSGQQHGYAKSFDTFAPMGPILVSPSVLKDVSQLTLVTRVNGQERQRVSTGDLLFDVQSLISFLSKHNTLRPGTVIMTGTPSGVAAFDNPPTWLRDGDDVEVEISGLGSTKNRYVLRDR